MPSVDFNVCALIVAAFYSEIMSLDMAFGHTPTLLQLLNAAVIDLDARGLMVKTHTVGDAAVGAGLDAIGAARKVNGFSENLHSVGHNSFVQMNDFRCARDIQATFEMSP